ncbi:MAG: ribosome-binding factor A [Patescibacteria group bacterium]|nr:ribosome-binding factor A [Patescibacteria group bacterium]MDE1965639.1 ribosome-binding factor A [Patescibacteria group bacterium]
MSRHNDKAMELIRHVAAAYIAREANRDALITPTRVALSDDGMRAMVYVSVFPDTSRSAALSFLSRHTPDFHEYLKKESRFARLPSVRFAFDEGEENRRHLDDLSRRV